MVVIYQAQEEDARHADVLYPSRCIHYPLGLED